MEPPTSAATRFSSGEKSISTMGSSAATAQTRGESKAVKRPRKLASHEVAGSGLEIYFRRGATMERWSFSTVHSGRILCLCGHPATLWLANFQLSLMGRKSRAMNPFRRCAFPPRHCGEGVLKRAFRLNGKILLSLRRLANGFIAFTS